MFFWVAFVDRFVFLATRHYRGLGSGNQKQIAIWNSSRSLAICIYISISCMPCLYVCVDNYHYIDYCWYIFAIYVSSGLSIIYTINCTWLTGYRNQNINMLWNVHTSSFHNHTHFFPTYMYTVIHDIQTYCCLWHLSSSCSCVACYIIVAATLFSCLPSLALGSACYFFILRPFVINCAALCRSCQFVIALNNANVNVCVCMA